MSWSIIGRNTVIGKNNQAFWGPKGHEKCDSGEPNLETAERAKTCSNHRKKWKISVKRPSQLAEQEQWGPGPHIIGESRWTPDQRTKDASMQDFCYSFPNALYFASQACRSLLTPEKAWWDIWRGPASEQPKDMEVAPWSLRLTTHY